MYRARASQASPPPPPTKHQHQRQHKLRAAHHAWRRPRPHQHPTAPLSKTTNIHNTTAHVRGRQQQQGGPRLCLGAGGGRGCAHPYPHPHIRTPMHQAPHAPPPPTGALPTAYCLLVVHFQAAHTRPTKHRPTQPHSPTAPQRLCGAAQQQQPHISHTATQRAPTPLCRHVCAHWFMAPFILLYMHAPTCNSCPSHTL